MGYQYRGSKSDAPEVIVMGPNGFDPAKCGSYAGYKQHAKRGVPVCDPCRVAAKEYQREYHQSRKKPPKPRATAEHNPAKCGTQSGYASHIYHRIPPCPGCQEAHRVYNVEWRAKRAAENRSRV